MKFSNVSSSQRLQSFMNMGLFHWVKQATVLPKQAAPLWLLSMKSQILPENLLQHGSSFHGQQVLPGACSSMGSPQSHTLLWESQTLHLLMCGTLHVLLMDL